MWFQVTETACEVYTENGGWLNDFDANDDCEITLDDFGAWAAVWLEDKNPSTPYIYTP